jgi:hypothetical protein
MENILELIKVLTGPAIVAYVYYRIYKYERNRE